MQEFPIKVVLLEYSPRDQCLWVRGLWREGKQPRLAPIHEDNQQNYVRVFEGMDNLANSVGFSGLAPVGKDAKQ